MQAINIADYIRSGNILNNFQEKNPFDLIVYEKLPENSKIKGLEDKIISLEDERFDFGINGKLMAASEKYKNILIIIDQINIGYLLPFIQKSKNTNFSIINIGSGYSSFINKQVPETADISLLQNFNIEIKEPIDFVSFFGFLGNNNKQYIRIPEKELPGTISKDGEDNLDTNEKLISLKEFGLTGEDGTILVGASMVGEIVQATSLTRQEDKNYDVFCVTDYTFLLSEDIKESIKNTEKLIIILDQNEIKGFENKIKSVLFDNQIIDVQIYFIQPNQLPTTSSKEYIQENIQFGGEGIYEKLIQIQ
ncbi:hypothetical protein [Candidatus Absconditicoccus praedator]|uniref:hypothetical protein n=1 Tax=Candidatus Absconditicoccus praedator TaxID=2735562 RepID=UPI001E5FA345|nr:hypothetical protein [Candidatus Absconditicoccus praedator]UFX83041.1 hypothetical protein HLG78_02800 [Candidatus Absconditicoccus praedator]